MQASSFAKTRRKASFVHRNLPVVAVAAFLSMINGCATGSGSSQFSPDQQPVEEIAGPDYQIAPGDMLSVFVWRNEDLSVGVPVRPDGKVSLPLVEDLDASGKTSSELAREIEQRLTDYIRNPTVTVIVAEFGQGYSQQVRVVGAVTTPQAVPYKKGMTLLDAMITAGPLQEYAAGSRASVVRVVDGKKQILPVNLDNLLRDGEIAENVEMRPGDIVIVPESWF